MRAISVEIELGNYGSAVDKIYKLAKSLPNYHALHFELGRVYIFSEQIDLAIESFKKAISLKPEELIIWNAYLNAVILSVDPKLKTIFINELQDADLSRAQKELIIQKLNSKYRSPPLSDGGVSIGSSRELKTLLEKNKLDELLRKATALTKKHEKSASLFSFLGAAFFLQKDYSQALVNFSKARDFAPLSAEPYTNIASVYLKQEKIGLALGQFKEALVREPNSMKIVSDIAECYNLLKNYSLAVRYLELLVKNSKSHLDKVGYLKKLGFSLLESSRPEQAYQVLSEAYELNMTFDINLLFAFGRANLDNSLNNKAIDLFDQILAVEPENDDALRLKASALQQLGDFDSARILFDKALIVNPNNGPIYRSIVTARKIYKEDAIINKMRHLLDANEIESADRMNLCFAISKAYEDIGLYSESIKYLNDGSLLMKSLYPFHISNRIKEIESLKRSFAKVDWNIVDGVNSNKYAPIFVTGMARSGTTLVEQVISSHSSVYGAGELGFLIPRIDDIIHKFMFGKRELGNVPSLINLELKADGQLTRLGEDFKILGDKISSFSPRITDKSIPTYLYIGIIKAIFPKARIIVVRRDPRDNLLSIYKIFFLEGTHRYAYDLEDLAGYYDTFVDMLNFWREIMPGSFYEIKYEDLVGNPEAQTRLLIDKCGLNWEDECLSPHRNNRTVRTLSVYQVRQPISTNSVGSWKRYEDELQPMIKKLRELGHIQ